MPRVDPQATAERLGELARSLDGSAPSDVEERGRERLIHSLAPSRPHSTSIAVWLVAAAFVGLLVAGIGILWPSSQLSYVAAGAPIAEGGYIAAIGSTGANVRFSDGTEVGLASGARARIADVTAHGARIVLEDGRATLRVAHLPRAAWSVVTGPFTVVVTGTEFVVTWSVVDQVLDVQLSSGAVTVRGPAIPSAVSLVAGQRLVARASTGEVRVGPIGEAPFPAPAPSEPTGPAASFPSTIPLASASAAPALGASATAGPTSWAKRVAAGDFRGVVDEAEARGIEAAIGQSSLSDLAALADAARYAGKPELARRTLEAERARFPATAEARTAAFLLGRMADDRGATTTAIEWYERYLTEAPAGPFAAEALGRKMEAVRRASGDAAARPIAEDYLRRFPSGPHAAGARSLSGP